MHALYGVDDVSELKTQVASLTAQLTRLQPSSNAGPSHVQMVESTSFGAPSIGYSDLQMGSPCVPNASSSREQVDFVGEFDREAEHFNPYSNTYNQGWRHHPNMSYANNSNVLNPPPMTQQVSKQPPVHQQQSF